MNWEALCSSIHMQKPASVAQLDGRSTGDQEVAGLTPARSATFFRGDLIMKYFLSLLLIQEGQLSVSSERICTLLVQWTKPAQ